jgi:hypothetical protein
MISPPGGSSVDNAGVLAASPVAFEAAEPLGWALGEGKRMTAGRPLVPRGPGREERARNAVALADGVHVCWPGSDSVMICPRPGG